jgi:hypothetical protein
MAIINVHQVSPWRERDFFWPLRVWIVVAKPLAKSLTRYWPTSCAFTRCITAQQLRHSNVKISGSEGQASRQDITILKLQFGQRGSARPNEATRSIVCALK